MASIKYSALGGELKGKIGSTIFQGGKSGAIVRNYLHRTFVKVLAVLYGALASNFVFAGCDALEVGASKCILYPDGSHAARETDLNQRSLLSFVSKSWSGLTPEQRDAWNASAVNFPFKNRFGDVYTGSGFQVFMELNLNLYKLNNVILTFPPAPDAPALPTIELWNEFGGDVLTANFPDGVPADVKILCFSSVGQSAGRSTKMKNPKLFAVIGANEGATIINLRYLWQVFFGVLNATSNIQIKFVAVNNNTGQAGSTLTKGGLIDAIASGSKLTKADAGYAFPDTEVGDHSNKNELISGYAFIDGCTIDFTGANADQFKVRYDSTLPYAPTVVVPADVWGNILPIYVTLEFLPTSAGAKSATANFKNASGEIIGTMDLTGTGTEI